MASETVYLKAGRVRPSQQKFTKVNLTSFAIFTRPSIHFKNLCPGLYVGASTSRNPKGLHGPYRDNFTLPFIKLLISVLFTLQFIYSQTFDGCS
jgi:hypothetical protein